MAVTYQHRDYAKAALQWDRCRDCFAGSDAVKGKFTKYLPFLEGTSASSDPYLAYVMRALFYPAMARTVSGLVGIVFGKPPTVEGIPTTYDAEFKDVTLTGVSLPAFGFAQCQELLITGRVGLLVDMANVPGSRPYWCAYPAERIVNWRTEIGPDGQPRLTLVVLYEELETASTDDFFTPTVTPQYRVLELRNGLYEASIWRATTGATAQKTDWAEIEGQRTYPTRRGQRLNYIPFVFIGPNGNDPQIDHPPLVDLVDVNLSHYRTSADQEHGAHFTALPTPYITGHKLGTGETLAIGSGTAWVLPNPNASAGMVEFSGAGLKALAELKEEKRQLMATLGARMLETQKNVQESGIYLKVRHSSERSALQVLASALSAGLTTVVRWHLTWNGVPDTTIDKVLLTLNPDVMDELSSEDVVRLVTAWQAGAISHKTLYHNLEWGEWTRPGVTYEQEIADLKDPAAPASTKPAPPANASAYPSAVQTEGGV